MYWNLALVTIAAVFVQHGDSAEFTMIPSTTTAAELWNPYTWFWPYAIASAESYRDFFQKAQKAQNELYQQIYATNANPFITGNWGGLSGTQKPQSNQNNQGSTSGQNNQNQTSSSGSQGEPTQNNQNQNTSSGSQGGNTTQETSSGSAASSPSGNTNSSTTDNN